MHADFEPIVRAVDLMTAELAEISMSGPQFVVVHRFAKDGICSARESVVEVCLVRRTKRIPLMLPLRLMILFDYLARNRRLSQNTREISTGISADRFCKLHGFNVAKSSILRVKVSRTSVKQQIMRLRKAMKQAFLRAGLNLDPQRILVSELTASNEIRYRLRGMVQVEHLEF